MNILKKAIFNIIKKIIKVIKLIIINQLLIESKIIK